MDLEHFWIPEKLREHSECGARRNAGCQTCKVGACCLGSISLTMPCLKKKKNWISSSEASEMLKRVGAFCNFRVSERVGMPYTLMGFFYMIIASILFVISRPNTRLRKQYKIK